MIFMSLEIIPRAVMLNSLFLSIYSEWHSIKFDKLLQVYLYVSFKFITPHRNLLIDVIKCDVPIHFK